MTASSPQTVFAALWETALHEVSERDLGSPAALRGVVRETGEDAFACIAAATAQDADALVDGSASLLAALTLLWAAMGIEPDEIWMELHKRERLGSLLHEMTTGDSRPARRIGRPWRVNSTKLP